MSVIGLMSKTLQVVYPVAIFATALSISGLRMVQSQAGNAGFQLFPENNQEQMGDSFGTTEVATCSNQPDHFKLFRSSLACADKSGGSQLIDFNKHQFDLKHDQVSTRSIN